MYALRIDGVKKSFRGDMSLVRREVLHGISLHARGGEVFGFLGPNGAGKTTTIKIVLGLIRPDAGSATIFDRPAGSREALARIGYLPEIPYFHPHLTLDEFLGFCARMSGVPRSETRRRIDDVVAAVDLAPHRSRRLRTFSKGMLQRAGLAQALVHDPDLLILDEPFSGLDPIGRKMVRDVLVECRSRGKTIFFSSHILPDMEALCDRVAIVRDGVVAKSLDLDGLMRLGEGKVEIAARGVTREALVSLHEHVEANCERGDECFIVVPGQGDVRPVIEHLYEHGAEVLSVSNRRLSLEDLFLREVGRPKADADRPRSGAGRPNAEGSAPGRGARKARDAESRSASTEGRTA